MMKGINNIIYYWFPALPFLTYWMTAYLAYHFGPFINPELNIVTHIYFLLAMFLFTIAYRLGLGSRLKNIQIDYGRDTALALKIIKKTSWLTFIGTLILVFDRINSGAGSLDLVQNELANLRQDYSGKTTALTTIGVFPQSFRIITFATYFYCLTYKALIPKVVHILLFLTILLEIVNMVLSANRGALFWIATFIVFFVFFCLRIDLFKELFSKKNQGKKILFLIFCVVSVMYFYFIAKYREVDSTMIYRGQEASYLLKDRVAIVDYADLGAKHQLFYYLTHGFQYTEAILNNAAIINFDFVSALGIRVESQIARFFPGYVFPAKRNFLAWIESAGLSPFGWPSIFGASLAYFGITGSLIFFFTIGHFSGHSTRKYIRTNRLGWLIIILTIYTSLNMSFDWILRDFDQYMALAFGTFLIMGKKKSINLQVNHAERN